MSFKYLLGTLLLTQISQISFAKDLTYSTACSVNNTEATISFVGDILIHKALYLNVVNQSKHFSQLWQKTDPLIQKAHFSVGNLEGPAAMGIDSNGRDHGDIGFVYDDKVYSGTNFMFNYHPRILNDLLASGYDLLTTANNHSLDRYSIGIDKTIAAAKSIGLPTVGTRSSGNTQTPFYKILSINSIRTAFVGCTEMTNGMPDTDNQVLHCYKSSTISLIQNIAARSDVDAVIVLPHWGTEYTHTPGEDQRIYARKFIDAGAIAVIGSHPHVLQPWEKYTSSNGREALIIYSLGNFVAGQAGLARKTGTVAYLGLSKVNNQKAKITGAAYTPTYRASTTVNPIGKNDSAEVLAHAALMYGTKSRVEPLGNLRTTICAK